MTYAALYCKSNFSFHEGASHPEELVETAHSLGLSSLAITDRDGVYGVVRAHVKARELGVSVLSGAEVSVDDGSSIVLLAMNRDGWGNLCKLLSIGRQRSPKGRSVIEWTELFDHARGLIALWGGARAKLALPCDNDTDMVSLDRVTRDLGEAFGDRLYAVIARHHQADEPESERRLIARAGRYGLSLVAAIEVLYHHVSRKPLQDLLTCVRHGLELTQARGRLRPNAEHALVTAARFRALFSDRPDAVERTIEVAERCAFRLDQLRYRYPAESQGTGENSAVRLRRLVFEGARWRYPAGVSRAVEVQLGRELDLIEKLDYGGYFLTMTEVVRFCREREILCQGRGSAANSAVCFCLGITAVDPVEMELLFERFLSIERAEPPDIDLDIQHDRREEVIQFIYSRYGRDHAAMVANVVRYRPRSAVRDVGRALAIAETTLDRVAKLSSHHASLTVETLAMAGIDPALKSSELLIELSNELFDFPRHLSIHPGGFLLGHDPVCELVPIEPAAMAGRTVVQWNKDDIEDLGLFKVDLLALGALTLLDKAFRALSALGCEDTSMAALPRDDVSTYEALCRADTVGVFQIESRAQMAMLPRLRPMNFYDLVIEISIVRPGPISGGMVHPYLRRRRGEETVEYPHPLLEPVLKKTLGIPLFQEQVMRLAVVAADYTPGEADQLRRDMAAWKRTGRMEKHHQRLVTRMVAKGIAPEFAERVFEQIKGFGEYGFPESHAASFARISYATAYLKRHHPTVFTMALLNAQPMGFYALSTIVDDARRHGVTVLSLGVCASEWECTLEPDESSAEGLAVRIGFRFVKGLRHEDYSSLAVARAERRFSTLEDFAERTKVSLSGMILFAESGAFEGLEPDRRTALWKVRALVRDDCREPLAPEPLEPIVSFARLSSSELIGWDYLSQRLSTRGHPLESLRPALYARGHLDAVTLARRPAESRVKYTGVVICRQRPATANGVVFFTLEDETGFVNLVVWEKTFRRYEALLRSAALLSVEGRVDSTEGVSHVIVERAWDPSLGHDMTTAESRDFH